MTISKHHASLMALTMTRLAGVTNARYLRPSRITFALEMLAQLAPVKGVLYLHRLENEAIVCAKTTNEYFQYLFETRDCFHIKSARFSQIYLLYIYGIVLKRHCSIRSFRSTGPSSKLNWSDMATTYRPTLQKNLMNT